MWGDEGNQEDGMGWDGWKVVCEGNCVHQHSESAKA